MTPVLVSGIAVCLVAIALIIGFIAGRLSLARLVERLDSNQRLARECMHEACLGRDDAQEALASLRVQRAYERTRTLYWLCVERNKRRDLEFYAVEMERELQSYRQEETEEKARVWKWN